MLTLSHPANYSPRVAISDRKQREWRMREDLILEHVDAMFRESGYLGLNLDQLAERIEYSKATIYNHFPSKEDLVLAVSLRHMAKRREFFARALTFAGRPRERMFVIGLADAVIAGLHPHAFAMAQLAQSPSIWEKTAPRLRQTFGLTSGDCMKAPREIIRQARREGDLPKSSPGEDQILFGLVGMSRGAHLLSSGPGDHRALLGPEAPEADELLKRNYHVFLDGTGWRPLQAEWDYAKTERRIWSEVFPAEVAELGGRHGG